MRNSTKQLYLRLLGIVLLAVGLLAHAGPADARLDPFYIVHGTSYGKLKPRILFVVDSSSTMRYKQPWADIGCDWGQCESWNDHQSRVHAARSVINKVTTAAEEEADFALMTFGQAPVPSAATQVPQECLSADQTQKFRFVKAGLDRAHCVPSVGARGSSGSPSVGWGELRVGKRAEWHRMTQRITRTCFATPHRACQRGATMVSVMLTVSLMTVAVLVIRSSNREVSQANALVARDRAMMAAQAAVELGAAQLRLAIHNAGTADLVINSALVGYNNAGDQGVCTSVFEDCIPGGNGDGSVPGTGQKNRLVTGRSDVCVENFVGYEAD